MSKTFIKSALLAGGLLLGCAYANAGGAIGENLTQNLGSAVNGETYPLTTTGQYYTYSPETSGLVLVQTTSSNGELFFGSYVHFFMYYEKNAGLYMDMSAQTTPVNQDGGYQFLFYVEEGGNYVVGMPDPYGSFDFTITPSDVVIPDVMTYCLPEPGTTFDYASGQSDIMMEFQAPLVSLESVELTYTDLQGNPASATIPHHWESGWEIEGNQLIARIAHVTGNDIFGEVRAKADTSKPFYLQVNKAMSGTGPVTSAKFLYGYPGAEYVLFPESLDGTFMVEYNFVDNVSLVSAEFPETFYSYWTPGSPEGMATLTFDGPVKVSGAQMNLIMGSHSFGDTGGEDPDPTFGIEYSLNEDKTVVTLNFTGVDYSKSLAKNYSAVTVAISGIVGENGLTVVLSNNGSNSLSKVIPYVNEPYDGADLPDYIQGTPTVTPAQYSVIRELQTVTVTWPEAVSLVPGMDYYANVQLENSAVQPVDVTVAQGSLLIDLTQVVLTDGRFTGTATIKVPAGIVQNADGDVNDTLTLIYTFAITSTGVESILDSNDGNVEIYNLKGVKVDSKNLTPGVYVINGKKVVVK